MPQIQQGKGETQKPTPKHVLRLGQAGKKKEGIILGGKKWNRGGTLLGRDIQPVNGQEGGATGRSLGSRKSTAALLWWVEPRCPTNVA